MLLMMAMASSGKWHQTSLPHLSPGFFMSRTMTRWRASSRSSQRMRTISSCLRLENSAKANTLGMAIEDGRKASTETNCCMSRCSSSSDGRRSRSPLRILWPRRLSTRRASAMALASTS
ncbi:hypothetical protein D3C84_1071850 [compost metagenome]